MGTKTDKITLRNSALTTVEIVLTNSGGNLEVSKALRVKSTSIEANGSKAMKITEGSGLGPNGATGGDVAKWLKVLDDTGSTMYIPAFL